jgi:hypothetical protein
MLLPIKGETWPASYLAYSVDGGISEGFMQDLFLCVNLLELPGFLPVRCIGMHVYEET